LARRDHGEGELLIFEPYYDDFETGCAAYLFGCSGLGKCAVVDAHEHDLDAYAEFVPPKPAERERILRTNQGRPEPQP
jgi:hypothetical protein